MTDRTASASTPAPIVAVSALAVLLGLVAVIATIGALADQAYPLAIALWLMLIAILAIIAVGALRAWRMAQGFAVLLGAGLIIYGLYLQTAGPRIVVVLSGADVVGYLAMIAGALLAGLTVIPKSARDWYAYEH